MTSRRNSLLLPMLAASALVAGCGSSSKSSSSSASQRASTQAQGAGAVVKTASNSKLGATVLVDSRGITLYSLSGERAGKFICSTASCEQLWHPLAAASTAGASVGSLGAVTRPDGAKQLTYKGMPLYTFAQDQNPGEANGQGFKDVGTWSAVTVSASSAATSGAPTTTTTSGVETTTTKSEGGRSYGY